MADEREKIDPAVAAANAAAAVPRTEAGPRLTPDEADALPAKLQWTLVGWYRSSGEIAAAATLLDRIEARGGETVRSLEERARVAFGAGRVDEATALLRERIDRAPSATAWVALARLLLEAEDHGAARMISDDLCRDHPDLVTVAALAADVARASGDLDTARAYHEGVLDARPDHLGALLALARIELQVRDARASAALLDRALAVMDETASSAQLSAAAALADELERPDGAVQLRQRALGLDAERAAALATSVDEALGRQSSMSARTASALTGPASARAVERSVPPSRSGAIDGRPPSRPSEDRASSPPAPGHAPILAPPEVPLDPRALEMLRDEFGFDGLRPGQAATIANVLAGRDTLAVMPTGAGKSLTFQLPAMLAHGTTLVLSPLIALMQDQVDGLPPSVREQTALLNSSLSMDEQRRVLDGIADGAYKMVYAAPERLRQQSFLRALRTVGVSLVVVDEAHCISLWGHDFRPDYLSIPSALPALGDPPLLAITATATPNMAEAIGESFGRELERIRVSVFRPNLFYEAHRVANREEKVAKVLAVCREERGAGIVYVSSRKDAETIAGNLRDRGVRAITYHAGLDPQTRTQNQQRFMTGESRVVVATVAFGMGVDKADVRFIVHLSPPRSLEAYAQESGRAGRDGLRARCVLLAAPSDQASMTRFARRDELDLDTVRRVYAAVKRAAAGRWALVDPSALLPAAAFGDDPNDAPDARIALGLLDRAGVLRRHPDAPVSFAIRLGPERANPPTASDPRWSRLATWAELGEAGRTAATLRTAETSDVLGATPVEVASLLASRPHLRVQEGPRVACFELLPVGSDVGARLDKIMRQARREAQERIAQVMAYAAGGCCRHVTLANHLGEGLAPCGDACDVCAGTATRSTRPLRAAGAAPGASSTRARTTAADALAVLTAVRTLPFPMGKTGLTKLLIGSVESRVRADRSDAFGVLSGLSKGKVDGLVDRLIDDGFLHRDLDHEYKLVSVTERGATATADDVAGYGSRSLDRAMESGDPADLDPAAVALLSRLEGWRRERASRDAVPPYVIAHNSTLREVAEVQPRSPEELARVKGFGPARVEKYGEEVLALVAGA